MVPGMSNPTLDRVRGELLREWRFSQNWDVSELAQRVHLSIGQIQQLETGGTSLFYSPAIRENAARKVAAVLGGDPATVIRPASDEAMTSQSAETKVVDDLIELSRQRAKAAQRPSVFARHPVFLASAFLSLAGLIAVSGWLQQKWESGGAMQFWREAAAPTVPSAKTAKVPVLPIALADTASQAAVSAAVTAPAPTPVQVAVETVVEPVADTSAPLCQRADTGPVITPSRPSKAGDMVYIVANKGGSVCVVDAAGVRTVLSLKAQEARSVYGAAPWRVNFEQPEQAQLYFQGERVRLPGAKVITVALHQGSWPR
jgi:transcriptional regulator with XRE-family HTH domain